MANIEDRLSKNTTVIGRHSNGHDAFFVRDVLWAENEFIECLRCLICSRYLFLNNPTEHKILRCERHRKIYCHWCLDAEQKGRKVNWIEYVISDQ